MGESFLKALLHDILGVLSRAGHAPRNEENPLLVSPSQDFKRVDIPAFGGNDKARVSQDRPCDASELGIAAPPSRPAFAHIGHRLKGNSPPLVLSEHEAIPGL